MGNISKVIGSLISRYQKLSKNRTRFIFQSIWSLSRRRFWSFYLFLASTLFALHVLAEKLSCYEDPTQGSKVAKLINARKCFMIIMTIALQLTIIEHEIGH